MFSRLKNLLAGDPKAAPAGHQGYRQARYEAELGASDRRFADTGPDGIEILAFARDFSPTPAEDEGYVLLPMA